MNTEKKYCVGIVPGSFDPITLGHLDVIKRAAELCDKVYVAVMINETKKYMFSIEQRKRIAEAACDGIENVEVISSEGMLYALAERLEAEAIIKGVRNETDRAYELNMAEFNEEHNPNAKTVLLDADPTLDTISSTLVREKIINGGELSDIVPEGAFREIKNIIKK